MSKRSNNNSGNSNDGSNNSNNNNNVPIDFSFMRTGSSPLRTTNTQEPDLSSIYDVGGLLMVFMEDAMELAETHTRHANRTNIQQKDILNGFKVRAVYESFFWTKPGTLERAVENKEYLIKNNDDEHSLPESIVESTFNNDDDDSETEHEFEEPFTKSTCKCQTCKWFWDIDVAWDDWNPQLHYQIILKDTVTQIFDD